MTGEGDGNSEVNRLETGELGPRNLFLIKYGRIQIILTVTWRFPSEIQHSKNILEVPKVVASIQSNVFFIANIACVTIR